MTIAKRPPEMSGERRITFGGYDREGTLHELVAVRPDGGGWQLRDITAEAMTTIETFAIDEDVAAVRAIADMYFAEMRI